MSVAVSVAVGVTEAVSVMYKTPNSASLVAVAAAGSALRGIRNAVFVMDGVNVFVGVPVAVLVAVDVAVLVAVFVGVSVGTTFEIEYTALVLNELSQVGSARVQSEVAPSTPAAITSKLIHSAPSSNASLVYVIGMLTPPISLAAKISPS